jgi:hypothetical protein
MGNTLNPAKSYISLVLLEPVYSCLRNGSFSCSPFLESFRRHSSTSLLLPLTSSLSYSGSTGLRHDRCLTLMPILSRVRGRSGGAGADTPGMPTAKNCQELVRRPRSQKCRPQGVIMVDCLAMHQFIWVVGGIVFIVR